MVDIVFSGQTPSVVIGHDELPVNVDIEIYKGDFYEFFVEFQDLDGNVIPAIDLEPKAQIRESYDSVDALTLDTSITDSLVRVYIKSSITAQMDASKGYIWDLQTTNYLGDVKTRATGDVTVMNEVTR